jgi:hypothetical protein
MIPGVQGINSFTMQSGPRFNFANIITKAGGSLLSLVQSDFGITLNNTTVSYWQDQSPSQKDYSQSVLASQPKYNIASLNGLPTLSFNVTSLASALDLPNPTTSPFTFYWVFKQNAWVNNRVYFGSNLNNVPVVLSNTATPDIAIALSGVAALNTGAPLGTWTRGIVAWQSVSSYFKLGTTVTTGNPGTLDPAASVAIGAGSTRVGANFDLAFFTIINGNQAVAGPVITALDSAVNSVYGNSVVI